MLDPTPNTGKLAEIPENVLKSWEPPLQIERKLGQNVWLVRSDDVVFVLKRRSGMFDVERERQLLSHLAERQLPVAGSISLRTGATSVLIDESSWTLMPNIPGRSVSLASISSAEASALGDILARLHLAFEATETPNLPLFQMPDRFLQCPHGTIHRDFHPSNVLLDDNRVTGVLDFDLISRGPRIFDIAYLGASLLADAFLSNDRFVGIFPAIVRSYHHVRALSSLELEALPEGLEAVEDLFIEFGKSINNYQIQQGATTVKQWLVDRRTSIARSLEGI